MESREIATPTRSGLQVALDIVIAPKAAFESLREVPTWGWALLIAVVLTGIGTYFCSAAFAHAFAIEMPAKLAKQLANLPAEQRDKQITAIMSWSKMGASFGFLLVMIFVPIAALIQSVVLLIANAITKGDGTFKKFWALSTNIAVVGFGLSSIVLMIIVLIRGPESYNSSAAIAGSIPGLGLLVPGADGKLLTFLNGLNAFYIWATVLFALGMTTIARIPRTAAIVTAVIMLLGGAGLTALTQQ